MVFEIFARWKGQTELERDAQTALLPSPYVGRFGCLHESNYGSEYIPLATKHLCPEAFERGQSRISAIRMQERLSGALALVEARDRVFWDSDPGEIEAVQDSYRAFVDLCELKERETGEPVLIIAKT